MHLVWAQSFIFAGEPIAVRVVPAYGIDRRGHATFPLTGSHTREGKDIADVDQIRTREPHRLAAVQLLTATAIFSAQPDCAFIRRYGRWRGRLWRSKCKPQP